MSQYEICRAAKPDADDGWCDHILWARTCFPFGRVTPRDLYRAASRQARAERNGTPMCDMCDDIAGTCGLCPRCEAGFEAQRMDA